MWPEGEEDEKVVEEEEEKEFLGTLILPTIKLPLQM